MSKVSVVRLVLFKDSEKTFLAALDKEGIPHSRLQQFTKEPRAAGVTESISAISEAMPWNSIAKVIVSWIDAKKNREIIVTLEGNKIFHAKGYSVKDIEKILPNSINVAVIDTEKEKVT